MVFSRIEREMSANTKKTPVMEAIEPAIDTSA